MAKNTVYRQLTPAELADPHNVSMGLSTGHALFTREQLVKMTKTDLKDPALVGNPENKNWDKGLPISPQILVEYLEDKLENPFKRVFNFDALPATSEMGVIRLVEHPQGSLLTLNLKKAGLYVYNSDSEWEILSDQVDLVEGKGLSTKDFTAALKTKLDAIWDQVTEVRSVALAEDNKTPSELAVAKAIKAATSAKLRLDIRPKDFVKDDEAPTEKAVFDFVENRDVPLSQPAGLYMRSLGAGGTRIWQKTDATGTPLIALDDFVRDSNITHSADFMNLTLRKTSTNINDGFHTDPGNSRNLVVEKAGRYRVTLNMVRSPQDTAWTYHTLELHQYSVGGSRVKIVDQKLIEVDSSTTSDAVVLTGIIDAAPGHFLRLDSVSGAGNGHTVNYRQRKIVIESMDRVVDGITEEEVDQKLAVVNAGIQLLNDNKVDKVDGKVLTDRNFTADEKAKLANLKEETNIVRSVALADDTKTTTELAVANAIAKQNSKVFKPLGEATAVPIRIDQPAGLGIYENGSRTGMMQILLPSDVHTYTMIKLNLSVFTYDGNSFDLSVGGYDYHTPSWYMTFAKMLSSMPLDKRKVRFFRTKNAANQMEQFGIAIGEADSVWTYPSMTGVAQLGYSGASDVAWTTKPFTVTISDTLPNSSQVDYTMEAN